MQLTVTVTGLDKAQIKLDRYHGPQLDRALGKATITTARTLVGPMKAAAPVRSGALRKSVKATRAQRRDKPGAIVGPRVWYRHFSIVGTYGGSRVTSNPWVSRTAAANSAATTRTFETVLHQELQR